MTITTIGYRNHPPHGSVLLKVIPGVPDLIVLNYDSSFGVERLTVDGRSYATWSILVRGSAKRYVSLWCGSDISTAY
jgi:hypothetical protein